MKPSLLLALVLFGGCKADELFLPTLDPSAIPFSPPPIYQEWFLEVKTCVDSLGVVKNDLQSVYDSYWFAITDSTWQTKFEGSYDSYHNAFWIGRMDVDRRLVITHEMIHSFGYDNGDHHLPIFDVCTYESVHDPVEIPELANVPNWTTN